MAPLTRSRKSKAALASSDEKKPKMRKTAQGKKIILVNMEEIKKIEINQHEFIIPPDVRDKYGRPLRRGPSIRTFIPSKTNQKQVAFEFCPSVDPNQEDLFPKNINPHIEAIQKLINTSFNFVRNYEFLMDSANEVIRILHWFLSLKSTRFDWRRNVFMKPIRKAEDILQIPDLKDCHKICMLAENGCVSLYPDPPGISEAERDALIQPMMNQTIPVGYHLPLNEEERKIWLDFKKSDKGNPEFVMIDLTFEQDAVRSIIPSDPIVSVIGSFAVAAFNKACATHFKKDEQNNLHDFEYMECKYVKDSEDYFFYMSIEAIEEGNLGVYETIVKCSRDDGRRTLLKFVLTDRTPAGTKAMAISLSSCLISLLDTLECVGDKRHCKLCRMHSVTRGVWRGIAAQETVFFSYYLDETVKGIRRVLSLNLQLLFQPECTRKTNPDAWSVPGPDLDTGMKLRNNGTPCMGYDYNPHSMDRCLVCSWGRLGYRYEA
uniref:uncharacterized protein LOC122599294 isoform X2 n=1 Tax=Erigeron canadensis TaxID=72917 RepID=UPI001CB88B1C|nr:uncharacterized protein LOC122599294 isoform X2 [Erigeron canadensis]